MNDEKLLYATLVNFSSFISYKTLYQLSTSYTVYMVYIKYWIGNAYTVKILGLMRSSHPEVIKPAIFLKKKLWNRCCNRVAILWNF